MNLKFTPSFANGWQSDDAVKCLSTVEAVNGEIRKGDGLVALLLYYVDLEVLNLILLVTL